MTFRILALNGGGIRGLFQAVYLQRALRGLPGRPYQHFDLIAGTSTGAILAFALALDIDLQRVVETYEAEGAKIFSKRFASAVRAGSTYCGDSLKSVVKKVLNVDATKALEDCQTRVLITATQLDTYGHKVFRSHPIASHQKADLKLFASDLACASSAGPSYFPPVRPENQKVSYVDGGLWANNPVLTAILEAHTNYQKAFKDMRVISVGNGDASKTGISPEMYASFWPVGRGLITTLLDCMFAAQSTAADEYAAELVGHDNFLGVSPKLSQPIPLDGVAAAKDLPGQAQIVAERTASKFHSLVTPPTASATVAETTAPVKTEAFGKAVALLLLVGEHLFRSGAAPGLIRSALVHVQGFFRDVSGMETRVSLLIPDTEQAEDGFPRGYEFVTRVGTDEMFVVPGKSVAGYCFTRMVAVYVRDRSTAPVDTSTIRILSGDFAVERSVDAGSWFWRRESDTWASLLCIPIRCKDGCIAVLTIDCDQPNALNGNFIGCLQAVADLLAGHLLGLMANRRGKGADEKTSAPTGRTE